MLTKKCTLGVTVVAIVVVTMILVVLGISGLLHHNDSSASPKEICEDTPDYLRELPQKPDDFDSVLRKMRNEADICELGDAYYLQPGFYVESWEDGKHQYGEHDYARWLVYGYGVYPVFPKATFSSNEIDNEVQICTLCRTGWGVETWQGVKLVAEESDFFEVMIKPDEILLPPTFPIFDEEWVKKLNITVRIKQTPSVGTYKIVVNAISPSEEKGEEWKSEVSKKNISIERMLEECIKQDEEEELNLECDELIKKRRNKYVESVNINVGGRLSIIVIVGEQKG